RGSHHVFPEPGHFGPGRRHRFDGRAAPGPRHRAQVPGTQQGATDQAGGTRPAGGGRWTAGAIQVDAVLRRAVSPRAAWADAAGGGAVTLVFAPGATMM